MLFQRPEPIQSIVEDGLYLLLRLDLSGCLSVPEQLLFVTESPALKGLTFLNLSKCTINEDSLQSIFDSPNLRKLEVLGLASLVNQESNFPLPKVTKYGLDHRI